MRTVSSTGTLLSASELMPRAQCRSLRWAQTASSVRFSTISFQGLGLEHGRVARAILVSLHPRQTIRLLPHGRVARDFQPLQIHDGDFVLSADGYVRAGTIGDDQDTRCTASEIDLLNLFPGSCVHHNETVARRAAAPTGDQRPLAGRREL